MKRVKRRRDTGGQVIVIFLLVGAVDLGDCYALALHVVECLEDIGMGIEEACEESCGGLTMGGEHGEGDDWYDLMGAGVKYWVGTSNEY